jgi:hypothetical protein
MDLIAILIDVYFSQDKKKHVSHEFLLEFGTVVNRRDMYYVGVGKIWVAFNKKVSSDSSRLIHLLPLQQVILPSYCSSFLSEVHMYTSLGACRKYVQQCVDKIYKYRMMKKGILFST